MLRARTIPMPHVLILLELASNMPKYIFSPYFIFLNVLGIVHMHLVGGGGGPLSHLGLLLPCFFSLRL